MTKTFIIYLFSAIIITSCGSTQNKKRYKLDLIPVEISEEIPIEETKIQEIDTLIIELGKELSKTKDNNNSAQVIISQMLVSVSSSSNTDEYKSELTSRLNLINKETDQLEKEINALEHRNEELRSFYSPENIRKKKVEIVEEEMLRYMKEHSKKKLNKSDKELIKKISEQKFQKVLLEKDNELLKNSERITLLTSNSRTTTYELSVLKSNNELEKILWNIYNYSYFETDSFSISDVNAILIKEDCEKFMDTIFSRMNHLQSILLITANKKLGLKMFIDGYSDSENFQNKSAQESDQLNLELSQKRVKTIENLITITIEKKIKEFKTKGIEITLVDYVAKGHGIEKPPLKVSFNINGEPDKYRRSVLVQGLLFPIH